MTAANQILGMSHLLGSRWKYHLLKSVNRVRSWGVGTADGPVTAVVILMNTGCEAEYVMKKEDSTS